METVVFPRIDEDGAVHLDGSTIRLGQTTYPEALKIAGGGRIVLPEFDDQYTSVLFLTKSGWVRLVIDTIRDRVEMVTVELPASVPLPSLMKEFGLREVGEWEVHQHEVMLTWPSRRIVFVLDSKHGGMVTHVAFRSID